MKRMKCLSMVYILSAFCLLAACGKQNDTESSPVQMSQETVPTSEVVESTEASSEETTSSVEEEKVSEFIVEEGGISVFLAQNPLEEANVRYIHAEGFLQDYGFAEAEPFYEYYDPDGTLIMTLYYDEETELGCGLRYYDEADDTSTEGGVYGFSFQGVQNSEWTGYPVQNYMALTTMEGDTGASQVSYYVENKDYDGAGRLSHYESHGVIPGTGLQNYITVLSMDYQYHSNGKLKMRAYSHSSQLFATSGMTRVSYFDEQGRLLYEDEYITHGSLDHYYIYEEDNSTPKYRLTLDFMHGDWMPVLEKFGTQ